MQYFLFFFICIFKFIYFKEGSEKINLVDRPNERKKCGNDSTCWRCIHIYNTNDSIMV